MHNCLVRVSFISSIFLYPYIYITCLSEDLPFEKIIVYSLISRKAGVQRVNSMFELLNCSCSYTVVHMNRCCNCVFQFSWKCLVNVAISLVVIRSVHCVDILCYKKKELFMIKEIYWIFAEEMCYLRFWLQVYVLWSSWLFLMCYVLSCTIYTDDAYHSVIDYRILLQCIFVLYDLR